MGDRPGAARGPVGPVPAINPKIAARVVNGEALILTPHDSVLHTLNPVATRIWELLRTHATLEDVVAAVVAEYDVAPEVAAADLAELLADLEAKQILV